MQTDGVSLKMKMKTIYKFAILLLSLLAVPSCMEKCEEHYGNLALNFTEYKLDAAGGSLMITVYYSSEWTASFEQEPDWAYITRSRGKGVTQLRVVYEPAASEARTLLLDISCDNGDTATITMKQAGI